MDNNVIIDMEQLNVMKDSLGDDFNLFLEIYLEEVQESLDTIAQLDKKEDIETLQRLTHSIKSASLSAGAVKVANIAKYMENLAINSSFNECKSNLEDLKIEFEKAHEILSKI